MPPGEVSSIYSGSNAVGAPPGKTTPGIATVPAAATGGTEMPGSANFTFEVPIVNLPGRGLDTALSLVYNSRLWNKSGASNQTYMSYDVDSGWPAPGFRLGYGMLLDYDDGDMTLIDPEGTRHEIGYTNMGNGSTDGTFIQVITSGGVKTATFSDGTRIKYGAISGIKSYPTVITDHNGNVLTISYTGASSTGWKINSSTDTLGRHINFFYGPTTQDLVTITAPGLGNGSGAIAGGDVNSHAWSNLHVITAAATNSPAMA